MGTKYDRAIKELQAIIIPYDVKIGYKSMRSKAKNIVEIYGSDEYKNRFKSMVNFNSLGDIRSDEEKHKVVLDAIENAVHFYTNKSAIEEMTSRSNENTDFLPYRNKQSIDSKIEVKIMAAFLSLLGICVFFVIYNNRMTFMWTLNRWQWAIIGSVAVIFGLNFFLHKISDKWLAVMLVPFALILQALLKYFGFPL